MMKTGKTLSADLPVVAVDWSNKGIHVTTDGVEVTMMASLDELLTTLDTPHRIVCEATVESWNRAKAFEFDDKATAAGHDVQTYRPIHTAKRRPEDMKKTDANDARVIYTIATDETFHTHSMQRPSQERLDRRAKLNDAYGHVRHDSASKIDYALRAAAALGPISELDPMAFEAMRNAKGEYSTTLLAVLQFCAERCETRDEFERVIGLHGSGYPSLLRSEIHHHVYRHAKKRGVAMNDFRRELRRAFSALKKHAAAELVSTK